MNDEKDGHVSSDDEGEQDEESNNKKEKMKDDDDKVACCSTRDSEEDERKRKSRNFRKRGNTLDESDSRMGDVGPSAVEDASNEVHAKVSRRVSSSSDDSSPDAGADDDEEEDETMPQLVSASSSSTSEDDDGGMWAMGNDEDEEDEDGDDQVAHDLPELGQPPAGSFHLSGELRARELGRCAHFTRHHMGSMHTVERMQLAYRMKQHTGCVNALNYNATGTRLCSGDDDANIVVWDWAANKAELVFPSGHQSNVFQTKFLPHSGDCHIVSSSRDGQIRLAELSTRGICKSTRRLARHADSSNKIALDVASPHLVLSCGEDAVVLEMDLRTDPAARKLLTVQEKKRKVPLYSVDLNPVDARFFCVSGRDDLVRVYDRRMLDEKKDPIAVYRPLQLEAEGAISITSSIYNHNGTEILASYSDDDIYTFDPHAPSGTDATHRYRGHRNSSTVKSVNYFGPTSEFVVSGSDCGHIFFWHHDSHHILHMLHGDDGGVVPPPISILTLQVNVLEPHPGSSILATSGLDDDVKIWFPSGQSSMLNRDDARRVIARNARLRRQDRRHPDPPDPDFILYMLRHMARERRNRDQQQSSEEGEGDEEEQDDRDGTPACRPS